MNRPAAVVRVSTNRNGSVDCKLQVIQLPPVSGDTYRGRGIYNQKKSFLHAIIGCHAGN